MTDLLATLLELEHLGVGVCIVNRGAGPDHARRKAMTGLLAIFAEFEREILRERTKAGWAHAREKGKRLGRPATATVLEDAHQGTRDAVVGYQFLENLTKFCHELYPSSEAGHDRRGQVRRPWFANPE